MRAGLIPERQFYAVPEPQFVVDGAEIVFDDVFGGHDFVSDLLVFESPSDEFDDALLPLVGVAAPPIPSSEHSCLRYKSVASFTRLTPLSMPKRTNSRLKWAFTVRRAMFNCFEISSLSQPSTSSSTTSSSPGRTDLSSIALTSSRMNFR